MPINKGLLSLMVSLLQNFVTGNVKKKKNVAFCLRISKRLTALFCMHARKRAKWKPTSTNGLVSAVPEWDHFIH